MTIILDQEVRRRFIHRPEGEGQFIRGTEFCHEGDIDSGYFMGFILVRGSLYECEKHKIASYGLGETDALLSEVRAWLQRRDRDHEIARALGLDPDTMLEDELEKLVRLFESANGDSAA